jgi:hypothetical protein
MSIVGFMYLIIFIGSNAISKSTNNLGS